MNRSSSPNFGHRYLIAAGSISLLLLAFSASTAAAEPPSSSFSYQGRLTKAGSAPSDSFDFRFAVYDALSGGHQVGSTLTVLGVQVEQGLFNIELDFGNALFVDEALWLEVSIGEGGSYTTLTPRQRLHLFSINGKQAPLQTPLTGLVTVGSNDNEVTGVGTSFTSELAVGNAIKIHGEIHTVAQIDSDTRLFLTTNHQAGALSMQAFKDGTLFSVRAGDRADILVVDGEGVGIGEGGTPISRIEHGTIGDCNSDVLLPESGSTTFLQPFVYFPRIFLSVGKQAGDNNSQCFTAATTSVSNVGFTWESWGKGLANPVLRPCTCINWLAIGIPTAEDALPTVAGGPGE